MTEKHFADKTFVDCHKNAKVFSLEGFWLYGMRIVIINNYYVVFCLCLQATT